MRRGRPPCRESPGPASGLPRHSMGDTFVQHVTPSSQSGALLRAGGDVRIWTRTYLAGALSGTVLVAWAVVAFVLLVSLNPMADWPISGLGLGGHDQSGGSGGRSGGGEVAGNAETPHHGLVAGSPATAGARPGAASRSKVHRAGGGGGSADGRRRSSRSNGGTSSARAGGVAPQSVSSADGRSTAPLPSSATAAEPTAPSAPPAPPAAAAEGAIDALDPGRQGKGEGRPQRDHQRHNLEVRTAPRDGDGEPRPRPWAWPERRAPRGAAHRHSRCDPRDRPARGTTRQPGPGLRALRTGASCRSGSLLDEDGVLVRVGG